MIETPVLFIFWRRTEKALVSFASIKSARPKSLYLASDGYRKGESGLEEIVKRTRRKIEAEIDWPCNIYKRYSEVNLGCGKGVSSAIDWFFSCEEMGIVIEDDCIVSQEYFRFAGELLDRYKDDYRVWTICADNRQSGIVRGDGDYYFSIYSHCWGWATWQDRWKYYDYSRATYDRLNSHWNGLRDLFSTESDFRYWKKVYLSLFEKGIPDTWDYQWLLTIWVNGGLNIIPNRRMVQNIGFDEESTNLSGYADQVESSSKVLDTRLGDIEHPTLYGACKSADKLTGQVVFGINTGLSIGLLKRKWKGGIRILRGLVR